MHLVLTGGAGFLGQHLVPRLAEIGHSVTVLDLHPSRVEICDLSHYASSLVFGDDLTDPQSVTRFCGLFAGADAVLHLAGLVSFWRKKKHALEQVNVAGTEHVAKAVREVGVPRLIHISSVAALGYGPDDSPVDESFGNRFAWDKVPHKHYMRTKRESELALRSLWENQSDPLAGGGEASQFVIANPGLMWGPGDLVNSARLINKIQTGKVPACPPGGTNIVDVRDVTDGLTLLLDRGRAGENYILGGENIPFRQVCDVIARTLGVDPPAKTLPHWAKPVLAPLLGIAERFARKEPPLTRDQLESSYRFRYFSSERADRELRWRPKISFEQTIQDSVRWLRDHNQLN